MTTAALDNLRLDYETCYKALSAEKAMRERARIFTDEQRRLKVGEMDAALAALGRIKDTAKRLLIAAGEATAEPEQGSLFGGGE